MISMKICAVISEFNPFHLGHKYIIENIRKNGVTHVVAIMSGNFVQRGEPAIISKAARTKMALQNGVDLVIEIPTVWSVSTAEKYAFAGVSIANALGCVDVLGFGSECGNIDALNEIQNIFETQNFSDALKKHLSYGLTFAKAREIAVKECLGDSFAKILQSPNNTLGIEYIKALKQLGCCDIEPFTIKRAENYKSASFIRKLIDNKDYSFEKYVPKNSYVIMEQINNSKAPATLGYAQRAIISKLRTMDIEDISKLPDISEGLENRIYKAIQTSISLRELMDKIKTKRYTMARIKRIILSAYLGITSEMQNSTIPYIRILGTNSKGLEILKKAKSTSMLPIVSRYSDVSKLSDEAKFVFQKECLFMDLYNAITPQISPCGEEQKFKMIKV